MTATQPGKRPGAFAERMIARYEAELADAHPVTDAEIAHVAITEQLVADWRRRLEATTHPAAAFTEED